LRGGAVKVSQYIQHTAEAHMFKGKGRAMVSLQKERERNLNVMSE